MIYSTFQVKNATMPRVGHKDLKRPDTKCLLHFLHRLLHWIHLGDINFQLHIIVYHCTSRKFEILGFFTFPASLNIGMKLLPSPSP